MHYLGGLAFPKRHMLIQEHWMLMGDGREGEKGWSGRAQGAVATAARAGLGEKSHSSSLYREGEGQRNRTGGAVGYCPRL